MASICAGEQYDFNGMILTDPGIYTTPSLCGSTDTLILTVLANPPVVELSERICLGDSVFVFGAFRSTAGIFLDTMPSVEGCDSVRRFTLNVDSPALSTFDISICSGDSALIFGTFRKLPGAYSMTFPGTESACDSTATINLVVNDLPMPGIDIIAACGLPTASVNLTGINASTTINWNDPALSGPQVMLTEGDYILSLATAAGCTLDTVISVSIPPAVPVELDVINPLCPSGSDGYLRLLPPGTQSLIGINGGQPIVTDSIGGLSAGTYQVEILDTSGCQQIRTAEIQDPQAFQLLLPRDTIIRLGAEIQIIGRLFGIDPSEVILSWFPLDFLSCDSCLVVSTTPVNSITYELSATDTFGCTRLEDIRILVDKAPRIYVPNAFSPNGDGVNDLFFPNFATEVEEVEFMQIYERWGGQVYLRENFPPNDPAFGWDGTLNGEQLNPNVFVWHLRVRLVDGTVITKKGDLTLLR
jgi:gliding motility-associated-like protein